MSEFPLHSMEVCGYEFLGGPFFLIVLQNKIEYVKENRMQKQSIRPLETHQRREAVFSSSTRNGEATMGARIRSCEGLAEHVGAGTGTPLTIFFLFSF